MLTYILGQPEVVLPSDKRVGCRKDPNNLIVPSFSSIAGTVEMFSAAVVSTDNRRFQLIIRKTRCRCANPALNYYGDELPGEEMLSVHSHHKIDFHSFS